METLRQSGQLSPEQEVALMKQQLQAVKQDCVKLKQEIDALKSGKPLAAVATETDACGDLEAKYERVCEERDKLRARCQQLENELLAYGDLPGEVEIMRERSRILDDVISERDSLHKRLKEMEGLEDEVRALKKKAERADRLEKELADLRAELQREGRARRDSEAACRGTRPTLSWNNDGLTLF